MYLETFKFKRRSTSLSFWASAILHLYSIFNRVQRSATFNFQHRSSKNVHMSLMGIVSQIESLKIVQLVFMKSLICISLEVLFLLFFQEERGNEYNLTVKWKRHNKSELFFCYHHLLFIKTLADNSMSCFLDCGSKLKEKKS